MLEQIYKFIKNIANLIKKTGYKPVLAATVLLLLLYGNYIIINNKIPLWKSEVKNELKTDHVDEINKTIENSVNYDFKINQLIGELLLNLRADRISIMMYHNGGTFSNGIPFIKITNTYETTSLGTPAQIKHFQQLPISMFAYVNKAVVLKKILEITDVESYQDKDMSTYEILRTRENKSAYIIGLYNEQYIPIGFMSVEYCREKTKLDSLDVEILKRNSIYITSLLK